MGFIKALLVLIAIPIIGFGVSKWVLSDYNKVLTSQGADVNVSQLCGANVDANVAGLAELCGQVGRVVLLQRVSVVSGVAAVLLLLLFLFAAKSAGVDRDRITKIFPPLVFVSLVVLALLVLVQGAILTYAAYLAEATAIGRVHYVLIGAIGLGALIGGFGLIKSSFELTGKQDHAVLGVALERDKHPKMFAFAETLAERLGARRPDHIVVGLEPNFYVTSANVQLMGSDVELSGETLYLSLPLARIFTHDEITSVIGHELGHFRGEDTFYSLKFAPVYSGLTHGVAAMRGDGDAMDLARLPAKTLLEYMIDVFHRNVSTISREREFAADKAATEVAPAMALATALLKIGLYANAWNGLEQTIADRMTKRKFAHNMSSLFASLVKYDVNIEKIPAAIGSVAEATVSHPTDSHPPTSQRIQQVGIDMADIDHDLLLVRADNSIDLIDEHLEIEEGLTNLQQQYYIALGVQVPESAEADHGGTLLAGLSAHMVLADGEVDPDEIDQAEAIGRQMSEGFDYIEFREFCHYPDHAPKLDDLLEAAAGLEGDAKSAIYEYLQTIASADNQTSVEEQALLDRVRSALGLA